MADDGGPARHAVWTNRGVAVRRFAGSIEIPLGCSQEERERFIYSWLTMMEAGIKCGEARREATS